MWQRVNNFVRKHTVLSAFLFAALFTLLTAAGGLPLMSNPAMDQRIGIPAFTVYQVVLAATGIILMRKLLLLDASDFKFKNVGKGLFLGWFIFVLMAVIVVTSFSSRSEYFIKPEPLFLLTVILFPFSTGLLEEVVYRGIILKMLLRKRSGTKKGILYAFVVSSVLFGVVHSVHFIWTTPLAVLSDIIFAVAGGVFLGAVYLRTKTLIAPILLHGLNNLASGVFTAFTSSDYTVPPATVDDVAVMLVVAVPLIIAALVLMRKVKPEEMGSQVDV